MPLWLHSIMIWLIRSVPSCSPFWRAHTPINVINAYTSFSMGAPHTFHASTKKSSNEKRKSYYEFRIFLAFRNLQYTLFHFTNRNEMNNVEYFHVCVCECIRLRSAQISMNRKTRNSMGLSLINERKYMPSTMFARY